MRGMFINALSWIRTRWRRGSDRPDDGQSMGGPADIAAEQDFPLVEADGTRLAEILEENDRLREDNDELIHKLMKSESVHASLRFKYWETLQALKLWDMSAGAILSGNRSMKHELRRRRDELLIAQGQPPPPGGEEDEFEKLPSFPAAWREQAGEGGEGHGRA